jgi:bacterioferritin (cytochrome b1)
MAVDTATVVDHLNDLLRGEISAAETYKMAIDKLEGHHRDSKDARSLHEMQREHGTAAQSLRARIRALGGAADNDSGMWGAWAQFTQGIANVFGDRAALKSLKEGEEHGLKDYHRTLDEDLDDQTLLLLQELAERQERHVATIDHLLLRGD